MCVEESFPMSTDVVIICCCFFVVVVVVFFHFCLVSPFTSGMLTQFGPVQCAPILQWLPLSQSVGAAAAAGRHLRIYCCSLIGKFIRKRCTVMVYNESALACRPLVLGVYANYGCLKKRYNGIPYQFVRRSEEKRLVTILHGRWFAWENQIYDEIFFFWKTVLNGRIWMSIEQV